MMLLKKHNVAINFQRFIKSDTKFILSLYVLFLPYLTPICPRVHPSIHP